MKRFIARHSPMFILAALCIVLAVISPEFRKPGNLQLVGQRTCVYTIMAVGQLLVILTAGIDLSVGSVAGLSGITAAILMSSSYPHGWPMWIAIGAGAAVGALCGAINGILVTKGRIPPFIATLGMMMGARGVTLLACGGSPVYELPQPFKTLGGTVDWRVPVSITLACVILFAVILTTTRFGRMLYATGGNLTGARLSGVPVDRVRFAAYTLCGLLSGFSGILLASRTSIGDPNAALGYELTAIAACVIGGASLMGGEGSSLGALAGGLIMQVLENFCNLKNISPHWQRVFVGSLVVGLVYYDNVRKRRAGVTKE